MRILVTVVCLCSSVWATDQLELAKYHAMSMGGDVVQVEGISMEPRLMEYDLVVIVPVEWSDLKPGDVVQFFVSEKVRTEHQSLPTWIHQVLEIDGDWIQTIGINNPGLDPFLVHKKDVIGKAVAVYLGGGLEIETVSDRAMNFFRSKQLATSSLSSK